MSPRSLLYALATVIAIAGLVLHLSARRSVDASREHVDRIVGRLLWIISLLCMMIGIAGPAPQFDRVDGNVPGAILLLMGGTAIMAFAILVLRHAVLNRSRDAVDASPDSGDRTNISAMEED